MIVKAILHSQDINVVRYKAPLPPALTRTILSSPSHPVVPQLLPVTSGGKQWRDVGYENGSAFVAGNCLSFCYFAASKSQMSAGVLSQTITCRELSTTSSFLLPPRLAAHILFNFRSFTELFLIRPARNVSSWLVRKENVLHITYAEWFIVIPC